MVELAVAAVVGLALGIVFARWLRRNRPSAAQQRPRPPLDTRQQLRRYERDIEKSSRRPGRGGPRHGRPSK